MHSVIKTLLKVRVGIDQLMTLNIILDTINYDIHSGKVWQGESLANFPWFAKLIATIQISIYN